MKPFEKALQEYGHREIKGQEDNPEVTKYFTDIGFDGQALKDETAWCSAFANWCCQMTGHRKSGKLNARSWLTVGEKVDLEGGERPQIGDIVVLWRVHPSSWKGHVGFFVAERKGYIYILGGNQSNMVKISGYPNGRLLEYRRPIRETL